MGMLVRVLRVLRFAMVWVWGWGGEGCVAPLCFSQNRRVGQRSGEAMVGQDGGVKGGRRRRSLERSWVVQSLPPKVLRPGWLGEIHPVRNTGACLSVCGWGDALVSGSRAWTSAWKAHVWGLQEKERRSCPLLMWWRRRAMTLTLEEGLALERTFETHRQHHCKPNQPSNSAETESGLYSKRVDITRVDCLAPVVEAGHQNRVFFNLPLLPQGHARL